jgi:hypothetical protein
MNIILDLNQTQNSLNNTDLQQAVSNWLNNLSLTRQKNNQIKKQTFNQYCINAAYFNGPQPPRWRASASMVTAH